MSEKRLHIQKFSEYDFMRLFISFMRVNKETSIDFDSLRYDLYTFYQDKEYQELFNDITCKEQIEGNYIELTQMIQTAELSGLLSNGRDNSKTMITITEEECVHIIASYSDLYFEEMNMLVKKYLYIKYLREKKDCRTCQNMSCRVESNEKLVDDCPGYIYHEINEKVGKQLVKTTVGNK